MSQSRTIGLILFDGVEELDFVGPFEVFTMSNEMFGYQSNPLRDQIVLISETGGQVTGAKGMRVLADHSFATAPKLDVMLVPGGEGTRREAESAPFLDYVQRTAEGCEWVTSVCTGSLVYAAAGLAEGKRITTHWAFLDALRGMNHTGKVVDEVRYVRDGRLVTAAGVSAGIDMALWLVGQMHGPEHARLTQKGMQYDPAPPYAAAV